MYEASRALVNGVVLAVRLQTLDVGDEHAGFVEVGVGVLDYYNSVHGERESGGA